jgi:hypothetical protein
MIALGVVSFTAITLKMATPPFSKMIAEQQRRYGELRAVHARFITHAEEIAFYGYFYLFLFFCFLFCLCFVYVCRLPLMAY